MKLIAKKEQTSEKKLRSVEKAKKTTAKPAATARTKKTEIVRKTDVSKKAVKKAGEKGKTWIDISRDYLREVIVELKKVIWPSRKETLGSTGVILVIVGLTGLFLGLVDLILSKLLHLLVH